ARLAQYERLTVMRLNPRRPQEPAILFSRCLPRPPEAANPLYENARRVEARWNEDFAAALDQALRNAASGRGGANRSPILAGLSAVAADPDFDAAIPRRRLVLVSDLLEHHPPGFTHYAAGADFARWRSQSAPPVPDFTGVSVRAAPLDRPEHAARQHFALEHFWPAYFEATSVDNLSFDPAA
ncbi:MAG TPA: hypothetical protein PKY87_04480, partial [Terricaulis sp.]|nr:hypothetical protein [Terricaulis sp.]